MYVYVCVCVCVMFGMGYATKVAMVFVCGIEGEGGRGVEIHDGTKFQGMKKNTANCCCCHAYLRGCIMIASYII